MPDYVPPVEAQENCILGICCDAPKRRNALADRLMDEVHLNKHEAEAEEREALWETDSLALATVL